MLFRRCFLDMRGNSGQTQRHDFKEIFNGQVTHLLR